MIAVKCDCNNAECDRCNGKGFYLRFEDRLGVQRAIQNEGLDYFILSWADPWIMPDDEVEKAFVETKNALEKFENLLREKPNPIIKEDK